MISSNVIIKVLFLTNASKKNYFKVMMDLLVIAFENVAHANTDL